jgi:uncharacterized membrane protein
MKQCPNCRNQITDEAVFCPICGTAVNQYHSFPEPYPPQSPMQTPPVYTQSIPVPPVPRNNPYDHGAKFDPQDVAEHKLYSLLCYLLDFVGIIIALLGAKESEFAQFHIRQAMKFTVLEALLSLTAAILCWTVVVPVLALITLILLMISKIICVINLCKNKSVEPTLIRKVNFLN